MQCYVNADTEQMKWKLLGEIEIPTVARNTMNLPCDLSPRKQKRSHSAAAVTSMAVNSYGIL